jgi:nucleoid-associated protein YgaU
MKPEKLTIHVEDGSKIEALFNPNKLVIGKSVNWEEQQAKERDVPELQFKNGQPRTLSIDLIFDTYDTPEAGKESVREKYTDKLFKLTMVVSDKHRPPVCELSWGGVGVFFQGVLEKLDQQFTFFMEDGTPVRATCQCAFKEWRTNPDDQRKQGTQSSDIAKMWIVKRGDNLSSIAAKEYSDARLWRPIAEENGIDDPFDLTPGTMLLIPTLSERPPVKRYG